MILRDTLKALKHLNNRLYWREYFRLQHYKGDNRFITNINRIKTNTDNNNQIRSTTGTTTSTTCSDK